MSVSGGVRVLRKDRRSSSGQRARYRLDGLHAVSKACHGFAVALQLAVGEESDVQVTGSAERRPRQLLPDLCLAIVRGHEEQTASRRPAAEGKIEESHDTGVDRGGVLHLECGRLRR